jgi:asparagine synthase (glutamine-hydrolysing)
LCGIAGIWGGSQNREQREHAVTHLLNAMAGRGPDGYRILHIEDFTIGFSMLSIVGEQKIVQPTSSFKWVTAINGEIYNYRELRNELATEEFQYAHPDNDTAIFLPLVERYPKSFLRKLDGMFAGCAFDIPNRRLHLFRDHVGIKPMFYVHFRNQLIFASTVTGLKPVIQAVVDPQAVRTYLECGYVNSPRTLLHGVRSVPPGSTATFVDPMRKPCVNEWFSLDACQPAPRTIRELVNSAVQSEIPDGWPVVSTLSGGIDSTLLTLLLHKAGAEPNALTVRYEGTEPDLDLRTARRISRDFSLSHIEVPVTVEDYRSEVFGRWRFDQPLSDPNAIALNRLCRQVGELNSRVLLVGDGADELFCGYDYYRMPARGGLRALTAAWTFTSMSDKTDRKFVGLLTGRPCIRGVYPTFDDPLRKVQQRDLREWLEANLLAKADRFGMADRVEVRVPFLRPSIVAQALSLPAHRKISDSATKIALREAYSDLLPEYVTRRTKQGFSTPIDKWLRGPLGIDLRAEATWAVGDTWDVRREQSLWQDHLEGRCNWGQQLWRLSVLRSWWRSVYASS